MNGTSHARLVLTVDFSCVLIFDLKRKPKVRNYKTEEADINALCLNGLVKLGPVQSADHPLSNRKKTTGPKVVTTTTSSASSSSDPLSSNDPLRNSSFVDPLSKIEKPTSVIITGQLNRQIGSRQRIGYLNWAYKKQKYLKKYTTDKNIPIISVCI